MVMAEISASSQLRTVPFLISYIYMIRTRSWSIIQRPEVQRELRRRPEKMMLLILRDRRVVLSNETRSKATRDDKDSELF